MRVGAGEAAEIAAVARAGAGDEERHAVGLLRLCRSGLRPPPAAQPTRAWKSASSSSSPKSSLDRPAWTLVEPVRTQNIRQGDVIPAQDKFVVRCEIRGEIVVAFSSNRRAGPASRRRRRARRSRNSGRRPWPDRAAGRRPGTARRSRRVSSAQVAMPMLTVTREAAPSMLAAISRRMRSPSASAGAAVEALADHDELLAAEAEHQVGGPHRRHDLAGDALDARRRPRRGRSDR